MDALIDNTTGSYNTAIGAGALLLNTTGINNTANGCYALLLNTTGSNNTALGYQAGDSISTGTGDIFIGANAGYNETASNAFYVNNIQETTLANDKAYSLLYGKFSGSLASLTGQQLTINGNVGIGTITPQTGFVSMGNVGIGTWTANSALQVIGNVGIGSVAPVWFLGRKPDRHNMFWQ